MSLLNILLEKNRAHVVSDTAAFMRGRLFGYANKCLPMPHLAGAISVRGGYGITRKILALSHQYSTARQLRELLPARLRAAYGWQKWRPLFEVSFTGIEDGRAFAWAMQNVSSEFASAFEPGDVDRWVLSPLSAREDDALISGFDTDSRGRTDNLDAAILRLAKAQRRSGIIGGHLIVTTVSQGGILQRKLHDFGDEFLKPLGKE